MPSKVQQWCLAHHQNGGYSHTITVGVTAVLLLQFSCKKPYWPIFSSGITLVHPQSWNKSDK